MAVTKNDIIEYWLGPVDGPEYFPSDKAKKWWGGDDALDAEIRDKFEHAVRAVPEGQFDGWLDDARGRLAVVILCDQFTRNIFRGTADMYAADEYALELVHEAVDLGLDTELYPLERVFLYMPLMHAEDVEAQKLGVELFESLAENVPDSVQEHYENFADFARRHMVVVEKFGRFPHRNEILGRETTAAESEHLKKHGRF